MFYGARIRQIKTYFEKFTDKTLSSATSKAADFNELKPILEGLLDGFHVDTKKYQYSYTSKLIHTINPKFPIYDSYVKAFLNLKEPSDTKIRREKFWENFILFCFLFFLNLLLII